MRHDKMLLLTAGVSYSTKLHCIMVNDTTIIKTIVLLLKAFKISIKHSGYFGDIKIRINRIIVRRNSHDGLCLKRTRQKSDAHPNVIHSRRNTRLFDTVINL